jgi:HEPN domain-containing protein
MHEVARELDLLAELETIVGTHDAALDADATTCAHISEPAGATRQIASELGLPISQTKPDALARYATGLPRVEDLRNRMREVRETMMQELSSINFLRATDDMEIYLDNPVPFSTAVADAFPNAIEDVAEAHQCFAFGRYTAAVFHSGRAMELVVKRLAKKIRIAIKRDGWQSYVTAIKEKIAKMPYKSPKAKAKLQPFCEAAAYLLHFKDAWGNETMHPKKTYTRDEALQAISGAGAFVRCVADKIFKTKGTPP